MNPRIAILGSGMAGFGAAHRFYSEGLESVIYEQKPYYGGHTVSNVYDNGFIFDEGPHISFTKDERIQKLFAHSVNQEYEAFHANVNNYWKGYWIKHPAQCNLYGLPQDLIVDVLCDFVHAKHHEFGKINHYADWLVATYGKTFAATFPMEYGLKYHTTSADNMSIDWLGPRLYQPKLEEVFRGTLSPDTQEVHYISNFRYPSKNGFVSYLKLFVDQTQLFLNHQVTQLDPKKKELHFSNGTRVSYEQVVSSIPLPEIIPLISEVPSDVIAASQRLACTTCVIVDIGIDRADISDAHWSYFYDRDYFFTRISFPRNLSPHTVPPGAGSIQVEVYFSKKYRPLDRKPEDCIQPVLADLKRCGLIHESDNILHCKASLIPYANVIFDLDRREALDIVHGYLDDVGVLYCGRYGEWGYQWTDESFKSGENAAQKVLDAIGC